MILISAPGSPELQDALEDVNVLKIVDILLEIMLVNSIVEQGFFKRVTRFLKRFDSPSSQQFEAQLHDLRLYHYRKAGNNGQYIIPSYVDELMHALEMMYEQPLTFLNYQRGAIVELLSSELVCSRCKSGECFGNQIIAHSPTRYRSDQVDVVVLSSTRKELEGYTCKINPLSLISPDCTNLTALSNQAQNLDFQTNIGVICFEDSHIIKQRVKYISTATNLHTYGTDNFRDLENYPF